MRNASVASPIRTTVAATVRAELARAGVSQTTAAAWIGVTQPAMSARLHARVPFTVDELGAIATGLDLPITALIEPANVPFRGMSDTHEYDSPTCVTGTTRDDWALAS